MIPNVQRSLNRIEALLCVVLAQLTTGWMAWVWCGLAALCLVDPVGKVRRHALRRNPRG